MADVSNRPAQWLTLRRIDWEDAFQFFIQFSAMEYALKQAGFLEHQEEQGQNATRQGWIDAQADWQTFGGAIDRNILEKNAVEGAELARLKEARRVLENPPPMSFKRKIGTDVVRWCSNGSVSNRPGIGRTIRCMKYVRNNLFHGEKTSMVARDKLLIQQSTILIDVLIACCRAAHRENGGNASDEIIKMRDVYDHYRRVIG